MTCIASHGFGRPTRGALMTCSCHQLDRVAKSPFVAFCSTEIEKCHFRFPHKSMTCIASHGFGRPARGAEAEPSYLDGHLASMVAASKTGCPLKIPSTTTSAPLLKVSGIWPAYRTGRSLDPSVMVKEICPSRVVPKMLPSLTHPARRTPSPSPGGVRDQGPQEDQWQQG
jgi:hypothetical protein